MKAAGVGIAFDASKGTPMREWLSVGRVLRPGSVTTMGQREQ
jgi:hypothetical protein